MALMYHEVVLCDYSHVLNYMIVEKTVVYWDLLSFTFFQSTINRPTREIFTLSSSCQTDAV